MIKAAIVHIRAAALLTLALCLLAGLTPARAARADSPAELAAKVQQRYRAINAISAQYHRLSRFVATGGQAPRTVEGSGTLLWARPLSLRLDQSLPRHELVIAGPEGVWWVRPKRKQAERYRLEHFTSGLKPLLDALGGLSQVDEAFTLMQPNAKELELGAGGPVLALSPRQSRMDLKRLVVWFDGDSLLLKGFIIESLMGDTTRYDLTEVKANPELPAGAFTYNPPQGFRVRDHRTPRD